MAISIKLKDHSIKLTDEYDAIAYVGFIDDHTQIGLGTVGSLEEVVEYLTKNSPAGSDSYIYKLNMIGKGWQGKNENVS